MMRPAAFRTAGDTHNCDCWIRHPSIPIGSCCFFLFGNVWNQGQLSTKQHSILYTWLAMIFWHWPSPKRIRLSIKIKTSDLSRTDFSKILFDWACLMVEKCALGGCFIYCWEEGVHNLLQPYIKRQFSSVLEAPSNFFSPLFLSFSSCEKNPIVNGHPGPGHTLILLSGQLNLLVVVVGVQGHIGKTGLSFR